MQKRSWTGRMVRAVAGLGAAGLVLAGGAATAPSASAQLAPTDAAKSVHHAQGKSCKMGGRTMAGANRKDADSLTPAQVRAQEKRLNSAAKAENYKPGQKKGGPYQIPVVFHVITKGDGTGAVDSEQLQAQIDVLNQGYSGAGSSDAAETGVRFYTEAVTTTANNDWYNWSSPDSADGAQDDKQAKKELHQGGLETLNVYVTGLGDGLLGYATFPGTGTVKRDGVVILNESLPGGAAEPYNLGDTLTHEAGHWLNLYHTFQGGCSKKNDRVKDTPAQNDGRNIFKCNEKLNTCKQAGKDPVHNFMSYGDDECLDQFTPGQAARIQKAYAVLRLS